MWILWLEWLVLALLVFWSIGAIKRLKRLRNQCKTAFAAVDVQFVQLIELLRSCARRQALKEQVAAVYVQHAQHALLPSADLLEVALQQARAQPLQAERIASLESAWQGVQLAWQTYAQICTEQSEVHAQHIQEWSQRWDQLQTLQIHSAAQFNTAVEDYNQAIAQLPACAIARISGHQVARTFQKDAVLLRQQDA